ncbi:MAG: glycosyltransferase family 4 protein [Alphaproteobacteria bacterium]|nr:glycosyltransferase family 4 protein [Alphaproteobacteria bacterium]
MSARPDPVWRRLGACAYRLGVNWRTMGLPPALRQGAAPCLWYGGARAGAAGGPALKLAKLAAIFPPAKRHFNLAYLLSNAPYLSPASFKRLRKAGVKTALNQNGVFYRAWFAGDWRARNLQMAIAHEWADHVFYQSEFCRRASLKFLGPRPAGWEILYNAVDIDAFTPAAEQESSPFLFLVTGKIDAHQAYRVTQALEGLALARGLGLHAGLIVAGILDDEVKRQAQVIIDRQSLQNFVLLPGPYSQAQAPGLYRSAQAYLTLTHQDACPTGVLEAMAAGLPIIHPTSGGVPELAAEAGIAIETGEDWDKPLIPSADAVAKAMLKAAAERATLSPLARSRAQAHFSFDAWIERHRRVFQDLLERT